MPSHFTKIALRQILFATGLSALLVTGIARAQTPTLGPVFVIDMENRNWTQPVTETEAPIYQNAAAPYINSLVTPGNPNAAQTAWASAYHNVLATQSGANASIHPSEPNYLWQEAGSNYGVANDNDPYGSGGNVATVASYASAHPTTTIQHLCGLFQAANISWKSYQEDTNLLNTTGGNANLGGTITSTPAPQSQWTVPLSSLSGTSSSYTNAYNGSHQYNFACKHDGTLYFTDTNGSTTSAANTSTSNPEVAHHCPLQQLATDLANNTVASYNLITPNQYNDMHTALSSGFTYNGTHYTGDLAELAQGDNFLSIIVPQIMASQAYQNNGCIIIWTDETEGTNQNDFNHTLMEIVISPLAKGNAFQVTDNLTHSSDVATLQEIFGVSANTATSYLNDAANLSNGPGTQIRDMANFFQPGVIPQTLTSPATATPAMPSGLIVALGVLLAAVGIWLLPRRTAFHN